MQFRVFPTALLCAALPLSASQATNLDSVRQLLDHDQYAEALSLTVKAIEADPADLEARLLQGVALAQSGRLAQAEILFKSLLSDEAGMPQVYNNLAAIYASQERFEQARMTLMTAIEHDPAYTMARENLGDLYTAMAAVEYRQALNSAPDNQRISNKLRSLADRTSVTNPKVHKPSGARQAPAQALAAMTVPPPPARPASHPAPTAPITAATPKPPTLSVIDRPTTLTIRPVPEPRPLPTPAQRAMPKAKATPPKAIAQSAVLELIVTKKSNRSGSRTITIKPAARRTQ